LNRSIILATVVLIVLPGVMIYLFAEGFALVKGSPILAFAIIGPASYGLFLTPVLYGLYPVIWRKKYYKRGFESVVFEFEFIKKIIIGEIVILIAILFLVIFSHNVEVTGNFLLVAVIVVLPYFISTSAIRMGSQIARKQFRFNFARACFAILSGAEDYLVNMRYLTLGLSSYNKYINRLVRYQIQDKYLRLFYSKFIRADVAEKRKIISTLHQAFDSDDYIQPIRCLSEIINVPKAEDLLSTETITQKIKLVGPIVAGAVPVIAAVISIIEMFRNFHIFP
jgi:hypothetical protein